MAITSDYQANIVTKLRAAARNLADAIYEIEAAENSYNANGGAAALQAYLAAQELAGNLPFDPTTFMASAAEMLAVRATLTTGSPSTLTHLLRVRSL